MRFTTQSSNQLQTIFGGGYVPEQRGDETRRHLPPADNNGFVVDFGEILKVVRAALSLR